MRTKLTALPVAAIAALALAAVALAGVVTVAFYGFASKSEVASFIRVAGTDCNKKWRKQKSLGINVAGGRICAFRTSVIADSSDQGPDQQIVANVMLAKTTPDDLRRRIYLSVQTRASDNAHFELRLLPQAGKWQVWRDPRGSSIGGALKGDQAGFIRRGVGKVNTISLKTFDYGSSTVRLVAVVNGKKVFTTNDSSVNVPTGHRTVVAVGSKRGAATGAVGVFDNVAVKIPSPF